MKTFNNQRKWSFFKKIANSDQSNIIYNDKIENIIYGIEFDCHMGLIY